MGKCIHRSAHFFAPVDWQHLKHSIQLIYLQGEAKEVRPHLGENRVLIFYIWQILRNKTIQY